MAKKITIQDIADELGITRNTVSKAFNNTGVLADATREKILMKAAELGYKQFAYMSPDAPSFKRGENKEIALFTRSMPDVSHFGSHLLNTFQRKISMQGYRLSMYNIRSAEINSLSLPNNFNTQSTAGIICIELFDLKYVEFICSQGIPIIFADTPANPSGILFDADILYMENHDSIYRITQKLIANNIIDIGFVGNNNHCHSFYERWRGYRDALRDAEIPYSTEKCILQHEQSAYDDVTDWLVEQLHKLKLPKAFICANDFIATDLIKALKKINVFAPDDILIVGFDNSTESRIVEPHLTTVHIPSAAMGYIAAELLLSRIDDKDIPYRITHVRTDVIYRESTGLLE